MKEKIPEALLRIRYNDGRCFHRPYVHWKNAIRAKQKILSENDNVTCHVYRLADEVYQINIFAPEEEELEW